jgi:hypothetical protein
MVKGDHLQLHFPVHQKDVYEPGGENYEQEVNEEVNAENEAHP